jgi:Fe2+ transport system protein FeoA
LNEEISSTSMTLQALRAGESGTVNRIAAEQATAKRLADMGFVRGAHVKVLRPGRPCLVRIGPTCVGLGVALQKCILLTR